MIWDQIMTALVGHLRDYAYPVPVIRGATGQVPVDPTIYVIRGNSGPATLQQFARAPGRQTRSGQTGLFVECWEHDADDYGAADQRLNALENKVIDSLPAFVQSQQPAVLNLELSIEPDGDLFRPSVGSRLTLNFTWRG